MHISTKKVHLVVLFFKNDENTYPQGRTLMCMCIFSVEMSNSALSCIL